MSKRHRKTREMMSFDENDDFNPYTDDMYKAPKGKKPKGKQRRESAKKAYYDD